MHFMNALEYLKIIHALCMLEGNLWSITRASSKSGVACLIGRETEDSVVMVLTSSSWGQNLRCGSQTPDPNPGLDVQPLTSHLNAH